MITRDEVLMGRDKQAPLTLEMEANLDKLLKALNEFRAIWGKPMVVSSGYRPPEINAATPGSAKHSNHMICLACDFRDLDGALDDFCSNNTDVLERCGLYLEHPSSTPNWCHLQAISPRSGNRIFKP